MHKCPDCGKDTNGTMSEGGLKWAVCDDCFPKPDPPGGYGYDKCTRTGAREDIDGWE